METIIDMGCGPGIMTDVLANEFNCKHIVGIDINPQIIEFAKQNHKSFELYSRYELRLKSIQ